MPWLQVETTAGHSDPHALEEALTEMGAVAVWLSNAGNEPVLEPAPGATPLWAESIVTALFADAAAQDEVISGLENIVPPADLRFSIVEDRDWQAEWQDALCPLQFGDRLWIIPDAGHATPPDAAVVTLQPGMAFGTGEHPTTAMCLNWLTRQQLGSKTILDYGCGSGLLGIAAVALGAQSCCAVDIDPQALKATRQNADHNGCGDRVRTVNPIINPLTTPNALDSAETSPQYDVLVANILSDTLIELGPLLCRLLKPGAPLALTGILSGQADQVDDAWADWADIGVSDQEGEWVLLSGHKHRDAQGKMD